MCETGHTGRLFTDAHSCFVGEDLRLYQCICPIATCASTPTGNMCRFTNSFLFLAGFMLFIWISALAAYVYMSGIIWDHHRAIKPEKKYSIAGGYYYEKLFGRGKEGSN